MFDYSYEYKFYWFLLMIFLTIGIGYLVENHIRKNNFMECLEKGLSEEFCKENFLDKPIYR